MSTHSTRAGLTALLTSLLTSAALAQSAPSKLDVHAERLATQGRGHFGGGRFAPTRAEAGKLVADLFIDIDRAALPQLRGLGVDIRTVLPNGLVTASAPVSAIRAIAELPGVRFIQAARQLGLRMDVATGPSGLNALATGSSALTGSGVIVGIIDSGIDIEHPDFTGRILGVWDHTLDSTDVGGAAAAPVGYTYGTEWDAAQIQGGYATCAHRDENGHGTHVAGTSAGAGLAPIDVANGDAADGYRGVAFEADFLVVEYDFDNVKNRNSTAAMVDAVAWIFAQATALGRPCVINMSLGSDFGPHDGTLAEERGIDALTGNGKLVVVAAGNAATTYGAGRRDLWGAPLHGTGVISGTGEVVPDVSVELPTGWTPLAGTGNDYVFFDLWYRGTARVQITAPNGAKYPPNFSGAYKNTWKTGTASGFNTSQGYLYVSNLPGSQNGWETNNTDNNIYIEISDGGGTAPVAGVWKIDLVPVSIAAGETFHSWNTSSSSLTLATYRYEGALSDSVMTIGAPATAKSVISVGAYQTKNEWVARQYLDWSDPTSGWLYVLQAYGVPPLDYYDPFVLGGVANFSSRGPSRDGRTQPFISAPGVGIVASLSQVVGQDLFGHEDSYYRRLNRVNPSGYYATLQGTSMATPCATGAIALLLEDAVSKGASMTPDAMKAALKSGARLDSHTGAVPNGDYGWGKLDVDLAMGFITAGPTSDTVAITSATWSTKKKQLTVRATSTAAPSATLTASWASGSMVLTWNASIAAYSGVALVPTKPTTVTVTSSLGGSASAPVN